LWTPRGLRYDAPGLLLSSPLPSLATGVSCPCESHAGLRRTFVFARAGSPLPAERFAVAFRDREWQATALPARSGTRFVPDRQSY